MDAISYLLDRKESSAYRQSAIALGVSVVVWLNFHGLSFFESQFSVLINQQPFAFLFGMVVFLTGLAGLVVSCLILAFPLHVATTASNVLRSWAENRILEEFTSTGLTNRFIVDRLLLYYTRRWLLITTPSLLFGLLVTGLWHDSGSLLVALVYLGCSVGVITFVLSFASCLVARSGSKWLTALFPTALISIPIFAGIGLASPYFSTVTSLFAAWLVGTVYATLASRSLAIFALDKKATLENWNFRWAQKFALKRRGGSPTSENPITARQEMVGRNWGSLLNTAVWMTALAMAMFVALDLDSALPFYTVMLFSGFWAAGRAATSLSQSLTQEMENSTLEVLRTTPMGSERFLKGWLQLVVKPLMGEIVLLGLAAAPLAFIVEGPGVFTQGHFFHCLIVALAAPYLGALFGASIAGQCKPRQDVAKQINIVSTIAFVSIAPQMVGLLDQPNNWVYILLSLGVFSLANWLLKAGARKSLNRVFLPQN